MVVVTELVAVVVAAVEEEDKERIVKPVSLSGNIQGMWNVSIQRCGHMPGPSCSNRLSNGPDPDLETLCPIRYGIRVQNI